jgi:dihydrofolate synthase/folylpolyglutamate synthase
MVAGTNGKGSSVAMLESVYSHAGYKVGSYTSPHLLSYNERIRIEREPVTDQLICQAFEQIDQARFITNKASGQTEEISLSYFEFGTLAALLILNQAEPDVVILEVGLGGRLDAVNIVDATVALITPVDMDHQSWLGNSREKIAFEKAGIIKPGSQVVYGDPDPAAAVAERAAALKADIYILGQDFSPQQNAAGWSFISGDTHAYTDLPRPSLTGEFQFRNAAAVLKVVELLQSPLPVALESIRAALTDIRLAGRFQQVAQEPAIFLDVAHNAHAVGGLADTLCQQPVVGKTYAVLAMLEDKAACDAVRRIDQQIDAYYLAGLDVYRGISSAEMKRRLQECVSSDKLYACDDVALALREAKAVARPEDRIIVFGSFYTVSAALEIMNT